MLIPWVLSSGGEGLLVWSFHNLFLLSVGVLRDGCVEVDGCLAWACIPVDQSLESLLYWQLFFIVVFRIQFQGERLVLKVV